MTGFANPIIGGGGALEYTSIHSPDFVEGVSGWSIDKDGNAYFYGVTLTGGSLVISGTGDGVFIYSGTPGLGNLIGAWVSAGVTEDQYGNPVVTGINVNQGLLTGVLLSSPTIVAAIITNALLSAPSITAAAISGGTITQTTITFNSSGGLQLCYATTTTTTTFSTAGAAQWTCPAGVTSAKVECWGGGAGGDGGTSATGGAGGGGGEYAQEPAYSVTPGNVYSLVIGAGGTAGSTGSAGSSGGQTTFDGTGVVANPGLAGSGATAGAGGTGSGATIHENGGTGGGTTSTGGAGGGGSGGSTGAGGTGSNSSSSSGAAGGAAGTGGGAAGGAGGSSAAGGSAGTAPGAAGGGAGKGGTGSGFLTFPQQSSASYFGSGSLRNTNGDVYQNYSSGNPGGDGDQYGYWYFNGVDISEQLAGKSVTAAYWNGTNLHTWYNNGGYAVLGYGDSSGGEAPGGVGVQWFNEGQNLSIGIPSSAWGLFTNGYTTIWIQLGPAGTVSETGNLYYYGYWDTDSELIVYYTEGSSETAGAGAAGQVNVTVTNASTLVCGVSPVAGSDSASNAYAAGFTGPITAIEPGSSPAVLETWHAPATTGFTTSAGFQQVKYRLLPDGDVEITGIMVATSAYTAGTTIFTFPAGYRPVTSNAVPPINIAASGVFSSAWGNITTAGVFSLSANVANAGQVVLATRFRLVA